MLTLSLYERREIPGFPGYYVDTEGNVFGRRGNKLLPQIRGKGYAVVSLRAGGAKTKHVMFKVHTLVLNCFVGLRLEGMECRHLNGKPSDNRLSNLCWGTPLENAQDKKRHGTCRHPIGEDNGFSVLTANKVRAIRFLIKLGYKRKEVANQFCVSPSAINSIYNRRTWKHVE